MTPKPDPEPVCPFGKGAEHQPCCEGGDDKCPKGDGLVCSDANVCARPRSDKVRRPAYKRAQRCAGFCMQCNEKVSSGIGGANLSAVGCVAAT